MFSGFPLPFWGCVHIWTTILQYCIMFRCDAYDYEDLYILHRAPSLARLTCFLRISPVYGRVYLCCTNSSTQNKALTSTAPDSFALHGSRSSQTKVWRLQRLSVPVEGRRWPRRHYRGQTEWRLLTKTGRFTKASPQKLMRRFHRRPYEMKAWRLQGDPANELCVWKAVPASWSVTFSKASKLVEAWRCSKCHCLWTCNAYKGVSMDGSVTFTKASLRMEVWRLQRRLCMWKCGGHKGVPACGSMTFTKASLPVELWRLQRRPYMWKCGGYKGVPARGSVVVTKASLPVEAWRSQRRPYMWKCGGSKVSQHLGL